MLATTTGQMLLFRDDPPFPSTRYQGSKLKLIDWIWDALKDVPAERVLDAFGGTGCFSHMLKKKGKQVYYNDILTCNWYIGLALIENDHVVLTKEDVDFILSQHSNVEYPTFIQDMFQDIYFTQEENRWLDIVVTNIRQIENVYKKALAYFALFQACIRKRPYNLFHRKNLYLRFSEVERSFGNKTTWDTPFETHLRTFVDEANLAVFSNIHRHKALNMDVFDVEGSFDLVYIDTPYISKKGVGVNYLDFYHFLEGLVNYPIWNTLVDYTTKHRKMHDRKSIWTDKNQILSGFDRLFKKFQDSILVVSYRSDGIPQPDDLRRLLKRYKPCVTELRHESYHYVLSHTTTEEVLLIGF